MATNYPGSLDSYSTKAASDTIAEGHINDPQDAIEAIEAKTGTGASTPTDGKFLTGSGVGTSAWAAILSSDLPSGAVVQVVNSQIGTVVSCSTNIPLDDTAAPVITEGDEVTTVAITPTSASNNLKIDVVTFGSPGTANGHNITALFRDAEANALAVGCAGGETERTYKCVKFTHYMSAPSTGTHTFRVRTGSNTGTFYVNGTLAGAGIFTDLMFSSITITEIQA